MFGFSFNTGSSLIRKRKESLEQGASVTERSRISLSQQKRETAELLEAQREMSLFEKKQRNNIEEISRRQRLIQELNKKEESIKAHMYELVKKTEPTPSSTESIKKYSRELDHIGTLKNIQMSEIEYLDVQNKGLDRKLEQVFK